MFGDYQKDTHPQNLNRLSGENSEGGFRGRGKPGLELLKKSFFPGEREKTVI